jgi:two-component system sensor histidine kinase MprB
VKLRTRLTLAVVAIVAVAVVGGAYAALYSTRHQLRSEVDSFLVTRSHSFTGPGPGPNFNGQFNPPDNDGDRGPVVEPDAVVQVIDNSGAITSRYEDQPRLPVDSTDRAIATAGNGSQFRDVTVNGVDYRVLTVATPNGAVQIARTLTETNDVLGSLEVRLAIIAAIVVALAGLAAWLIARRTTKPIEQLTAAAEHVADTQDLSVPVPGTGDDEVGRLATSFNTMLIALDTSREQQKRLVMDASHELRTPLTAVRTNIDLLQRATDLDPAERATLLRETRLELDELTNVVTELVELATDARSEEPEEPVALAEVADDVAARTRRRTGRDIRVTKDAPAVVLGRRSMLDRAVANLVGNAVKFSPGDTPVEVVVRGGIIEVLDRGSGVANADVPRVFDRFYRAENARTLPGSGLGLAIVKQIVELHGGSVTLAARAGGGAVAVMTLPPEGQPRSDGAHANGGAPNAREKEKELST